MAVVVFIMMAGAVTLTIFKQDINIIITLVTVLAVPVLAGFGFKMNENLQEIKTQTNGKNDKQMDINQKQAEMFAEAMARNNEALMGTIRQLQDQVTSLALQIAPPPIQASVTEPPRELDDHPSQIHVPGQSS